MRIDLFRESSWFQFKRCWSNNAKLIIRVKDHTFDLHGFLGRSNCCNSTWNNTVQAVWPGYARMLFAGAVFQFVITDAGPEGKFVLDLKNGSGAAKAGAWTIAYALGLCPFFGVQDPVCLFKEFVLLIFLLDLISTFSWTGSVFSSHTFLRLQVFSTPTVHSEMLPWALLGISCGVSGVHSYQCQWLCALIYLYIVLHNQTMNKGRSNATSLDSYRQERPPNHPNTYIKQLIPATKPLRNHSNLPSNEIIQLPICLFSACFLEAKKGAQTAPSWWKTRIWWPWPRASWMECRRWRNRFGLTCFIYIATCFSLHVFKFIAFLMHV